MKISGCFLVGWILLLGASANAVEFPPIFNCIDAQGKIVGGGSDSDLCRNALPKCTELMSQTESRVKSLLSMAIYGLWMGYDLDLNRTTLEKPVGKVMSQGMCSVVGHKIRYQGERDLEFNEGRNDEDGYPTPKKQVSNGGFNGYSKKPCGLRPAFKKADEGQANGKRDLHIVFQGEQGAGWIAAMKGMMPWIIRRAAYDFLTAVRDKPEEVSKQLTDQSLDSLVQAGRQTRDQMKEVLDGLPTATRGLCTAPDYIDLPKKCEGLIRGLSNNDPVIALCNVVTANKVMQEGGVTNAIVAQIMAKATKDFEHHQRSLLEGGDVWEALEAGCEKRTRNFAGLNRRARMAKQASCFHDGDWMRTSEDWNIFDAERRPKSSRKNQIRVAIRLDRDPPVTVRNCDPVKNSSPYKRHGVVNRTRDDKGDLVVKKREGWDDYPATLANGFMAAVEYIIRRRICGQSAVDQASTACDENFILDKPVGVNWETSGL